MGDEDRGGRPAQLQRCGQKSRCLAFAVKWAANVKQEPRSVGCDKLDAIAADLLGRAMDGKPNRHWLATSADLTAMVRKNVSRDAIIWSLRPSILMISERSDGGVASRS